MRLRVRVRLRLRLRVRWQKAPEVHARQPRSDTGSPTGEHEERLVWLAR